MKDNSLNTRGSNRVDLGQQQLDALDADLRSFLLKYQAGERTVTSLISTESLRTRHHVSSEVSRLEGSLNLHTAETRNSAKDVKKHVSQTVGATMATFTEVLHNLHLDEKRQENRGRFLKSLKFPGMNERRQQIPESFPRTFRWAFADEAFGDGALGEDVEVGDNEGSNDARESDDSGGKVNKTPESNNLRRLRTYQVAFNSRIRDTPWDNFGDWLRSDSPVYWISGKPGAGKTTLVKYLLSNAKTKSALDVWNSGAVLLSHFFWRPGSPMQQNIKGLLCSLLHQLVEANGELIEHIVGPFDDAIRKETYTIL